jgi:hypothetical protein
VPKTKLRIHSFGNATIPSNPQVTYIVEAGRVKSLRSVAEPKPTYDAKYIKEIEHENDTQGS